MTNVDLTGRRVGQLEHAFKGTDGQVVIRKHITGIHTELFATFRERGMGEINLGGEGGNPGALILCNETLH